MWFTEEKLAWSFRGVDLQRGRAYFKEGRVVDYVEKVSEEDFEIRCRVVGRHTYDVKVKAREIGFAVRLEKYCDCPQYDSSGSCKHITAALYAHFAVQKQPDKYPNYRVVHVAQTNSAARKLLSDMRAQSRRPEAADEAPPQAGRLAHLTPVLTMPSDMDNYFHLSLRVGVDRPYVVKDVGEFVARVDGRETFAYGKRLTLTHDPANFDEPSRRLIDFIRRMAYVHTVARRPTYRYGLSSIERLGGALPLPPKLFEEYYDFLAGLPLENSQGRPVKLLKGDPEVRAEFARGDGVVVMNVRSTGNWQSVEDGDRLCCSDDAVLLCSEQYARGIAPLLRSGAQEYRFTFEDMPSFCSLVLPRIRDGVDIVDPDGVLAEYMPDECVPRFYFDLPNDFLTCRLVFHYDSGDIPYGAAAPAGRRDLRTEDAAVAMLKRDFSQTSNRTTFAESDREKIVAFLCGPIDAYRECGEVFVSDRLSDMEVRPSKASVGISVSDGMLNLSFDTGGFPPEELEALYQSLLARRRYHRLKDGRFMRLSGDGSGVEALAETAHMTQLSPAELKKGEVALPAFRALYLDGVLDKREGLRVKRDAQFLNMVRRFKTVEDSDYPLPEGISGELRPYQETGYRWLMTLESCGFGGILADEMGLGKTLQTIAFFAARPRRETGLAHLVACPASLVLNWQDELQRFAPGMKVKPICGTLKERRALLSEKDDADVWVTSYDLLKRDVELYADKAFYGFVLDEGQFVKNQSTKASKAVKRVNCRQRFVLTGTPVENRLSELWNLFDFLMPGYLFAHQRFVERLEKPIVQQGDDAARQQLNRMVRPFMLRRLKKDVLRELPDKIEHVRRIPLSESERKVYHAQSLAALTRLEGTEEKLEILAALTRLRQICCDPNLCFENYEGETSKLEACLELVHSMSENGHQILLFSQFTSMLARIRERLDREGVTSFTLQGSTPRQERARLVKEFNRGGAQVFLISLKAGGTGLNLTAADVVIHYDPWWNIAAQNQATDRAHRIGQQNCVQVYKLIAGDTVEERILELQNKKAALLDAVTENAGEDIMKMSREELMALIKDD